MGLRRRLHRCSNLASLAVFVAVAAAALNALTYAVADEATSAVDKETPYASEQSTARKYGGIFSAVPPTDPALCPKYGCPLLPRDIAFDTAAKEALESIRAVRDAAASADAGAEVEATNAAAGNDEGGGEEGQEQPIDGLDVLRSAGDDDRATLTLVGYKGGKMEDQVNQDRAFVLSPYRVAMPSEPGCSSADENPQDADKASCQGSVGKIRLLGVFDGHGKGGEFVSDHATANLPQVLAAKLEQAAAPKGDDGDEVITEEDAVKLALSETFIEIDRTAPSSHSGGCTATVVLQLGKRAYVANAGDSRSFLATFTRSTGEVKVIYTTREDKPDLPDEKERVERMGGRVYIPEKAGRTSRVYYTERFSGKEYGLAMSRSLGDWDAGKVGVIPDPIVHVINLEDALVGSEAAGEESCAAEGAEEGICTAAGGGEGGVEVFAVSATDGMLDFVSVEDIVKNLANSLYLEDSIHTLSVCEALIGVAAGEWHKARAGRYRDDIAIAVSKLDF